MDSCTPSRLGPSAATSQPTRLALLRQWLALGGIERYIQDAEQDIVDSYVPWPSPPRRGEDISNILRDVENAIEPLPLDPRLTATPQPHVASELPAYKP